MLYTEIMDSLHVYIYHLYFFGLRVVDEQDIDDMDDDKDNKETEDEYIDNKFAEMSK